MQGDAPDCAACAGSMQTSRGSMKCNKMGQLTDTLHLYSALFKTKSFTAYCSAVLVTPSFWTDIAMAICAGLP